MGEKNFTVNAEKCTHCGLCIKDCMANCLKFNSEKIPTFRAKAEKICIKCQHCMAICPTGAISILGKDPKNSDNIKENYNSEELLNLIKSRRSFRNYKKENINKETLLKLKEMLNYAPTGVNDHSLHFSFIDDIDIMEDFRDKVNKKLIHAFTKTPIKHVAGKFAKYKKMILKGDDIVFRGAPHMVVVSTSLNSPCPAIDPVIALSYFELYAQSLGVGTLWCGLAQFCIQLFPELSEELEIPQNYKASYVMLFGTPKIKYARTIQPNAFSMVSVQSGFNKKIDIIQKVKRFFWNNACK